MTSTRRHRTRNLTMPLALVAALLLLPHTLHAEWIPLRPDARASSAPAVTILEDNPSSTLFRVDVAGFERTSLTAEGRSWDLLDLGAEATVNIPGHPDLPVIARTFIVPDNALVTAEIVESAPPLTFSGIMPPPARPSWEEGKPAPAYLASPEAYAAAGLWPASPVEVGRPQVFRDFRILRVAVRPLRYDAASRTIEATPSITVRLRYAPGPGENPRTEQRRPIPPSFAPLYRAALANYPEILARDFGGAETGRDVMLCFMPDSFATSFAPYAAWRHATGTEVHVVPFSQIGANATNPDIIKNYIAQTYVTWTYPPTHVLLVGDYGKVPRKTVSYDYTFANEDYFVELAGNDYFPEMMIGRFTHETNYRLQVMINKFLKYEQTPWMADTSWFRRATVCSNDNYESQIGVKRFTAEVMLADGGFLSVDTMMSKNPCLYSLTDVVAAINSGRSFLNYRGEGWSDGWHASCYNFGTSSVSSLNNGQKFTFVTSIGCGVAMFDNGGGNCFGEEWVELGSLTSPRGAVAFVGPTSNTHTTYNNKIDKGIYTGLFQEGMESPGQALLRGKLYMFNVYGDEHWVEYHYRIYCILGDPAIHIWKTTPRPARMTAPAQAAVGFNQIEVLAADSARGTPIPGATVTVTGDGIFVTAVTDAAGRAILGVMAPAVDTLTIAVRGPSIIPRQNTLPVAVQANHLSPDGPAACVDTDGNLDGRMNPGEQGLLTVHLKNWGTLPASNVQASLSAIDTALIEVLTTTPAPYGTIAPESSATGSPFAFRVRPASPVGAQPALNLRVTAGLQTWNYTVLVNVTGCILACTGTLVNDQGAAVPNGRLDPGETVVLVASLQNIGEDGAPGVRGILRSTDSLITVIDSIGTFGPIAMGASAANTADFFVVTVNPAHPVNATSTLMLEVSTTGGLYPYAVSRAVPATVGLATPADPTGPDPYGYYMYTSEDSVYDQAPAYSWVEIDGLGTVVPRNSNGDFTTSVTLPFPFPYYGRPFTSLRISSDGWVAFGSGTQTSWQNNPLPNDDNVNNMVAAFWDDLFPSGTSTTGRLLYYSDAPNHRFIVEWYNVGHYSDSTDRETFQMIFLDPAHYPTVSGNGDIIIQYHTITEDGSMTLGMEDSSETRGLTYVFDDVYDPSAQPLRDQYAVRITTERPTLPSTGVNVTVNLTEGWNMLSNPVRRPAGQNGVLTLFPTSLLDYVYGFSPSAGYTQHGTVENGPGYWAKFGASGIAFLSGEAVTRDTVHVEAGWNMLGSISGLVDTAAITTVPPGIRTSLYYGYGPGYTPSRFIVPGQAYWVKFGSAGQIILTSATAPASGPAPAAHRGPTLHTVTITDAGGAVQSLLFTADGTTLPGAEMFTMPPFPPEGVFDARFLAGDHGSLLGAGGGTIALRNGRYPLTVTWDLEAQTTALLIAGGATRRMEGAGSFLLQDPGVRSIRISAMPSTAVPAEFSLGRNYPNPFNPATTIPFGLPRQSRVTIEIFNTLGQRVRTLMNTELPAGMHTAAWDGTGDSGRLLGSGVHFIRLRATGDDGGVHTFMTRALLLK